MSICPGPEAQDLAKCSLYDLAPCLIAERKQLHKIAEKLQENPTNYKTRHRDTPFKVWIETLKPGEKKWETWEVEAVQGT